MISFVEIIGKKKRKRKYVEREKERAEARDYYTFPSVSS